ncbi:MAG: endonuclease III [Pseudomonadota bacterium]
MISEVFSTLAKQYPKAVTELNYINNYTLLVAVVLSAQATDVSVNIATKPLFAKISTPAQMLNLGETELITYIKSIGLFRNKAKNVIKLSKMLINKFNSEVPDNHRDLISLPGVGTKTAKVVLNVAFGQPTIAVDTHVGRLSTRLGLTTSKNPDVISNELEKIIPLAWRHDAHHHLILHGRYICTARKPKCDQCVISQWCQSKGEF